MSDRCGCTHETDLVGLQLREFTLNLADRELYVNQLVAGLFEVGAGCLEDFGRGRQLHGVSINDLLNKAILRISWLSRSLHWAD